METCISSMEWYPILYVVVFYAYNIILCDLSSQLFTVRTIQEHLQYITVTAHSYLTSVLAFKKQKYRKTPWEFC